MPQLEFTIWLSNAMIKWIVVFVFMLFMKSYTPTFHQFTLGYKASTTLSMTKSWPW